MTLEQRVYEKEILDYMTDETPREFTIEPGMFFPVNEHEGIANYDDEPVTVSITLHMGKTLIGFHGK